MKNTIFALIGSVFASVAIAATPAAKPVLGFVELDKTTQQQVEKSIQERGCRSSWQGEHVFEVASGCFNLPGRPSVKFYFYNDTKEVYMVGLKGSKGSFKTYANSLRKTYGAPSKFKEAFVGDQYALWKKKDIVVELDEPHLSWEFELTYVSRGIWNRWEQQQAEKKKKNADDLNNLI